MRVVILDSFTTDQGGDTWDGVRAAGSVTIHPRTRPSEVVARCAEANAVLTNKVVLDAAAIAALPTLRYVGVMATGTNIVDLDACRSRGIAVSNVPGYSTESVAQLVFALLLHLTHDVAGHSTDAKGGRWAAAPDFCFFRQPLRELAGQTIAIVGSGAIGSAVARIAAGFGMRPIPAMVPGSTSGGRMPLIEAVAGADVVSLHCPLTAQTTGLVGRELLRALKPGAIVVNTGRGALIDEGAVVAALASGTLGGLCLDVLAREPPAADHVLLDPRAPWAARVVVTPHIAWGTVEARARLVAQVAANLAAFAAGRPLNRVA